SIQFKSERAIVQSYEKKLHRYHFFFKDTSFEELAKLHTSKHPFIRNIIIREVPGVGTNAWLVLNDENLTATVDTFKQPFRVRIAIHDLDFRRTKNPLNQLPSLPLHSGSSDRTLLEVSPVKKQTSMAKHPQAQKNALKKKSAKPATAQKTHHQLLKPQSSQNARQLIAPELAALNKIPLGRGKAWASFPAYVYPLNITAYHQFSTTQKRPEKDKYYDLGLQAVELYRGGHEYKALFLLDRILAEEPHQFTREPIYSWIMAECHLGQANLALARGYFQSLIKQFPNSELQPFAQLRKWDIDSNEKSKSGENLSQMSELVHFLDPLLAESNPELKLLANQRFAYWGGKNDFRPDRHSLARLHPQQPSAPLYTYSHQAQTKETKYLTMSLALYEMCFSAPEFALNVAKHINHYTQHAAASNPEYFEQILSRCESMLSKYLHSFKNKPAAQQMITVWEALPAASKSRITTKNIQWYLAEAYRNQGNTIAADHHYAQAHTKGSNPVRDFLSLFYPLNHTYTDTSDSRENKQSSAVQKLTKMDKNLLREWNTLPSQHQNKIMQQLYPYFQGYLKEKYPLKSVSEIVLTGWNNSLHNINKNTSQNSSDKYGFTPRAEGVTELITIAGWFGKLGQQNKRIEALQLLKKLKPDVYPKDTHTSTIWASEMLKLADHFRNQNAYLEAGRTFSHVAENAISSDHRAESFYKGGLLLYRAGKREEAIAALTKASQDGNNLFYANLAKERLNKLQ
ncbi:MAG: tetratricopeptide repeat protein, partial [Zetaproteobacteria bacterium]|nr:tetratricopeptide repeat protein [Zetaproteobacteria bacterium]